MTETLSLQTILEKLGYAGASSFERVDAEGVPGLVGVYRHATSADNTLVDRPVVYIAQADDDAQAREIHRKLWNRGDCPFLFLFLPTELLVYSGFNYPTARDEEREPLFKAIQRTAHEIDKAIQREKVLSSFTSRAIDGGQVWSTWGGHLSAGKRVDRNLLRNLKALSQKLQGANFALPQRMAHALIGKYIYFRYLKDRGILTEGWLRDNGIAFSSVFGREASAIGFNELSNLLQETFNGDIFPLADTEDMTDEVIGFVASVFNGDDPVGGQMSLFDAAVFNVYQFDYIPVELLSSIYEQFLHEQNVTDQKDRGGGAGAYYTPKSVADYVISELQAACPLTTKTRVLDPSCGSGVFLVLAYQRLVALHKTEKGRDLTRVELRDVLTDGIFGIEINEEACGITEFSLLLALMSYLEPRDLQQNQGFHFPNLRDRNIFQSDFFENCLVFTDEMRFQWVAGNPPWFTVPIDKPHNTKRGKEWETFEAWLQTANERGRPIGSRRTCEAFCWRASDLVAEDGCVALLIHATTLVNVWSSDFRKQFFSQMYVRRITNFSNLASHLFENSNAPGAVVVYSKAKDAEAKQPIVHFAPFVVNQTALQHTSKKDGAWVIAINKDEVQWVHQDDAEADEGNLWKICLWGTYHDRRTLQRLSRLFPTTLNAVITEREKSAGWCFGVGPQVMNETEADGKTVTYQPGFEGKNIVDMSALNRVNPRPRFFLPQHVIRELEKNRYYIRRGESAIALLKAPHAIINASFALYCDVDFIIPDPQVGLRANLTDGPLLKAICLYLNASVSRYMLFFSSSKWGVSVDSLNPSEIRRVPFPELTDQQIKEFSIEHDRLSNIEKAFFDNQATMREAQNFEMSSSLVPASDVQNEIDTFVGNVLRVPSWITVLAQEFMQLRYQLKKGKVEETGKKGQNARADMSPIGVPTEQQLARYAEQLRNELDAFARVQHRVNIEQSAGAIVATVEITEDTTSGKMPLAVQVRSSQENAPESFLRSIQERRSQWVYVQRSVKHFDGEDRVHLLKQNRLLDWTRTQAFLDAGDIIAGVVAGGK